MQTLTETTRQPRYRWAILAAAAGMLAIAMGQLVNGISAYFVPLESEFGWSRADVALINTSGLLGLAVGGIVMGLLADRISIRIVGLFGAVVTGMAMIAASRSGSLSELYAIFFLAGALGGGALFAPLFALVGGWFRAGAGLAIGIASAGQAAGQGSIPLLNGMLIEALGWRQAFAVSGTAMLAFLVVLALLLREAPRAVATTCPAAPSPAPISWRISMPLLSASTLLCCSLMSVPLVHLMPLIQSCGLSSTEAGGALLVMLLSAIAGRVAFGRLADCAGAIPAYLVASAWQTALVFGFTMLGDITAFYVFAPIYGFGYGGVMTCVLTTIGKLAPSARRSGATGSVLTFAWVGHGVGGWMGGVLFDLTLSYKLAFLAAAGAGCANLVILSVLWRLTRRKSGLRDPSIPPVGVGRVRETAGAALVAGGPVHRHAALLRVRAQRPQAPEGSH